MRIRSETTIGRENAALLLDDREVSRRHAVIRPTEDGFVIEDVGSLNGTVVNGVALTRPAALGDGDVIEIGQSRILVELATTARRPVGPASRDIPDRVGPYELGEVIRQDSMFTIYKAFQESLDRYVAIKLLNSAQSPELRARFRREARILGRLQHPNILPIYDQGETNGIPYLVVQYLDSETSLEDVVGKPMEPARALKLIGQVLLALEHAHRQGVVHRNVKPANVLLPLPTWPMLSGFEIARLIEDSSERLTREGMVIGTPAYISPEQTFGLPADARSDLYSVGILLYELLTGRVPFTGGSATALLKAHAYEPPPPARTFVPDLPAEVEPFLEKALAKKPEGRHQSAREMLDALDRLVAVVEGSREIDPLVNLYKGGVAAFKRGQWDAAIERLERLLTLDPTYEDAESLLEMARQERNRAAPGRYRTPLR